MRRRLNFFIPAAPILLRRYIYRTYQLLYCYAIAAHSVENQATVWLTERAEHVSVPGRRRRKQRGLDLANIEQFDLVVNIPCTTLWPPKSMGIILDPKHSFLQRLTALIPQSEPTYSQLIAKANACDHSHECEDQPYVCSRKQLSFSQ